ncbi:BlaI/MecI/CopY family transcriptional regulator [Pacificimonas sp. WHA3]|uniref:BlaI/MecI/CopY family transcriptional regulator n=1 Tax=Pacificimonas pallii TaxID=2827236 RepID=A0ABS6SFH4_9SPHN|nr:BlaI/MecI/CopY family transcriptional regulator [Pacificimonas pallii]MBV7257173.1 BlaI/MecI/CopY family transcriptional regulator [Pacificimonas pallii]
MSESSLILSLPRREREVFELLVTAGQATAGELLEGMRDPPSYSAVRALLARLEGRGVIERRAPSGGASGPSIVYAPVPQKAELREGALKSMISTFFGGSAAAAATALLGMSRDLSADDIDKLQDMIDRQKREAG